MSFQYSKRFPEGLRIPQKMPKNLQNLVAKQDHQLGAVLDNNSKKYHDPDKAKKIKMAWTYSKKGSQ